MTLKLTIEPMSPGTTKEGGALTPGTLDYAKDPTGPVVAVFQCTSAQIQGIQGYVQAIKNAQDTTAVETEIGSLTL